MITLNTAEKTSIEILGNGLLRHLAITGKIGLFHSLEGGRILHSSQLIALTRTFFLEVEQTGNITCGVPEQPYIHNKSSWAQGGPLGGYLGEEPLLLRSDVVRSFDSMWSLHREFGAAKGPTLRAVAWICYARGFAEAIRYLFDLQRGGLIAGVRTLSDILMILVGARSRVSEDSAVPSLILRKIPLTPNEWFNCEQKT